VGCAAHAVMAADLPHTRWSSGEADLGTCAVRAPSTGMRVQRVHLTPEPYLRVVLHRQVLQVVVAGTHKACIVIVVVPAQRSVGREVWGGARVDV